MANRIKRETVIQNLVSDFESMKSTGAVAFVEEKSYVDLIEFYQHETQLSKAIEVVDFALSQFQFRSEFYLIKAKLLFEKNLFQESLDLIEIAETISPFEFDIQLFKVKVFVSLDKIDLAKQTIKELEQISNTTDLGEVYLCESYIYEWTSDFDSMFQSLKKALLHNGMNQRALERIWQSVELSKNFEESIFLHKDIIDKTPYNSLAWFNLGHAYSCVGEYEFAIDALEYSFIVDADFEDGYLDCAELCFQLKDYTKALSIYSEAIDRFGYDEDILLSVAHCQFKLGHLAETKISLKKAIQLDPYHDEAYYLIAKCYMKDENIELAIKSLNKATYLDETREEYFHSLARCYVHNGDFVKAKKQYYKAAKKGAEQSLYWEEYISFLIKLEEFHKALEKVNEAEKYTYSDKLQYCKSAILFQLGDRDIALKTLEEAIAENSDNLKFFYDLIPDLQKDSEVTSAIRYFNG